MAHTRQMWGYKDFPGKRNAMCHMGGQIMQADCPEAGSELLKDNMGITCQVS